MSFTFTELKEGVAKVPFSLWSGQEREKAHRVFYGIKRQCPIEIPIRIWLKILESVIEPIELYGSEVWGPLTNPSQDLTKWEKHPIETLHAELCKNILHVHQHTTNTACRAELGKYPIIIKIQKRAIQFWKHLKLSDPQSYHYKALQYQEMSKESKPFFQLIQSWCFTNIYWCSESQHQNQSDHCTNQTELHHSLANPNSTTE